MKKFLSLIAAVLFAGSMMAEEATMTAGTNGSACTVNDVAGIKCGTSKAGGDLTITVGAGATKLTFYAAAWKGVTGLSLNLAADGVTISPASVSLTADDGITNNSPFTLVGSAENFKFEVDLTGVTAETTIAVTSSAAKRFVVWGASYEAGGVTPPAVATPVISGEAEFTESVVVTITCSTPEADIYYTTDGTTDPTCDCAAAPEYTQQIVLTETTTIKAAAYTGNAWSAVATKTFTKKEPLQPITCAAVYELAKDAELALNNVVVTYANGKNVYVQDETGSMLLYLNSNTTWEAGNILSGVEGKLDIYNGLYEVKMTDAQAAAVQPGQGEAPAPVEFTAAPVAADMNKYIVLKNVTVSAETFPSNKNMNATIGDETFVLRNQFNADVAFETTKAYDIIGAVAVYNSNVQVYFINATESAPAVEHTYTVAGNSTELFGTAWAPSVEANDMAKQEDGSYKFEKTELELAAGTIEFKVCEDHAWDNCWPAQNYQLSITESGIYTITITFDADTKEILASAQKTGEAVVIPSVAMHGNFLGSWADTENFAVAEGDASASLTLNLAAGNYEFGMRIGGSGNWTSNGVAFTRENNAAEVVAGQGNLTLAADVAGEYTFTWTYATNNLAITFPAAAPVEMTAIYDWAGEIGTTIFGGNSNITTGTVKIHENTDDVSGIKFGSSYVYADGKWLAIKPAEGGFKAGDVLSVSVVFNNSDVTKYCMVDVYAADQATRLFRSDSASTLNGRNAGDPIVQTYTLEADQDSLFLGRYGNTGMFVTLLKVERAGGDEPQPQECDWDAIDFLGDGSTEQTHSNQFKVCKVGEQPNVVNIQTPGFAAETGIYVTFPSAVFGEISLAEGQYLIEGAGMVLYLSAFTQEYTEVTVNWDGNDIVFTVYNAAAAPQPVEHTYTVAGGSAELFGTTWNPANTANDMTKLEDGTYKWEKTEVTLPAGNVEFKVCEDHAWDNCWPAQNYQLVIPEAGVYTITITYNPEGNVVAGDAVKTGDAQVDPVVSIAGSMNSWNASADVMVLAEDKATASLTLNLAAQTYEFKVVINGGDWRSNAHEFTRENATAAEMTGNLDNMHLVADVAGEYVFTWTFATNTLVITYPNAGPEPLTIPENAPVPTVAEDDVMAIYCNHYANNNANFGISGWAGGYQTLDLNGINVGYWTGMTWECIIDPAHTDDAHDFSAYKNLHVDLWAPLPAKIKFTAEAVAGGNYKDGQVIEMQQGWNNVDFVVAEWPGNYDFKNLKCFVFEQYQTLEGVSFEGNPFAFANIYFYGKEGQGIDNTNVEMNAVKFIENGQLIILKNGVKYNVMGVIVR